MTQATKKSKSSDPFLMMGCYAIAIASAIALPNPFETSTTVNHLLLQAIPLPAAILMLFLPLAIRSALFLAYREDRNNESREHERLERARLTGRIIFNSSFRPHIDGSSWEVINDNKFCWTDTRILIERQADGELLCEKHQLGEVRPGMRASVESKLKDGDYAIWRLMVLTREGSQTDFPERGYRQLVKEESQPAAFEPELEEGLVSHG